MIKRILIVSFCIGVCIHSPLYAEGSSSSSYTATLSTSMPETYKMLYERYLKRQEQKNQIRERRAIRKSGAAAPQRMSIRRLQSPSDPGPTLEIERSFAIGSYPLLTGITQASDGSIYICGDGFANNYMAVLVKLSSGGDVLWSTTYSVGGSNVLVSIGGPQ